MFFNVFMPYFIAAFWGRDVGTLGNAVLTFMLYKQLMMNIFEFLRYESNVKLKIRKVTREHQKRLEFFEDDPARYREADMVKRIEEQIAS